MFRKVTEWTALGAVMHYCIWLFIRSSSFRFSFDDTYRTITFSLLAVVGFTRLLTGLWMDFRRAKERKASLAVLLKGLIALGSLVPCIVITQRFGYVFWVYLPLVAFCLYGIEAEKALRTFAVCIGMMLAATVLSALSGAIRNLIYLRMGTWGKLRSAYGICYPTDFSSYLVYLLLFAWCSSRKRGAGATALMIALALGAAWLIYTLCDGVTSTVCMLLMAVVMGYDLLQEKVLARHRGARWVQRIVDGGCVVAFPVLAAVIFTLVWLYGQGNAFAYKANGWLSDRLLYEWTAYQKYGIHGLGALTVQNGQGNSVIYNAAGYEYLDSTYVLLLIRYGWVLTLGMACMWVWMTWKAIRTGHRRLALAMTVIAFHSFAEHHFPEVNFNLMVAMPLCAFPLMRREDPAPGTLPAPDRRKSLAGWAALGVAGVTFALLLPGLLSWARTLFALEGWQDLAAWSDQGEKSLPALFFWLLCLGGAILLGVTLRRGTMEMLEKRRPSGGTLGMAAALICAVVAGCVWTTGQVRDARPVVDQQMAAEAEPVKTALATAEEPVYAGQWEWLYRERYPEIRGRVFSPGEIGRLARGSVLLERADDGYPLLNVGAVYTELSPDTNLFTFDQVLVAKLSEAGYTFSSVYLSEREVDLGAFVKINQLERMENGGLLLTKERPFNHGPYLEQRIGNYTVTFTLQLINADALPLEQEICSLRAATGFGKSLRAERLIQASEFDAEGRLTVSVTYDVPEDSRGVEYLIFPRENVEMAVERVAWKRN